MFRRRAERGRLCWEIMERGKFWLSVSSGWRSDHGAVHFHTKNQFWSLLCVVTIVTNMNIIHLQLAITDYWYQLRIIHIYRASASFCFLNINYFNLHDCHVSPLDSCFIKRLHLCFSIIQLTSPSSQFGGLWSFSVFGTVFGTEPDCLSTTIFPHVTTLTSSCLVSA